MLRKITLEIVLENDESYFAINDIVLNADRIATSHNYTLKSELIEPDIVGMKLLSKKEKNNES